MSNHAEIKGPISPGIPAGVTSDLRIGLSMEKRKLGPLRNTFLVFLFAFNSVAQGQSISWSPKGDRLVHSLNFNLTVVDVDALQSIEIGVGWAPKWSPTSDQILFVLSGRIFLVNADGSDPLPVATGQTPLWSPDGRRFAFSTRKQVNDRGHKLDAMVVHLADSNGDNPREAFEVWGPFIEPLDIYAWWPMGIAYEVWNLIPEGTSEHLIDLKKKSHVDSRVGNPEIKFNPGTPLQYRGVWSPASEKLAFPVPGKESDPKYRLSHLGLDVGIHMIDLSLDRRSWEYHASTAKVTDMESVSFPSWSPDGRRLVFAARMERNNQEIFIVGSDGTGLTRITHSEEQERVPEWSPRGDKIAFFRGPRLIVIDVSGLSSHPTRVEPRSWGETKKALPLYIHP